jgi:pimeloyl-ACP methyl ester carboxylesterase
MTSGGRTTILWRPTGPKELELVRQSGWRTDFPILPRRQSSLLLIHTMKEAAMKATSTSIPLLVHSELDPVPVEWAHTLADTIPGADYVLLEGASHFAHLEDADQLANGVLPWLTKDAA